MKSAKEILKASNKELIDYIKEMLGPLAIVPANIISTTTFDPKEEESKNLLLEL